MLIIYISKGCQFTFEHGMQERPATEQVRKDKPAGQAGKEVHGVRLGAGDRSYLVRDKQIEVLKNVYGGVQVSRSTSHVMQSVGCISMRQL